MENTPNETTADRAGRDDWTVRLVAVALAALFVSVVGVGLGLRAVDEADQAAEGAAPAAAGGEAQARTVDVELGDLYVRPAKIEVVPGTALTVRVVNKGKVDHDLKLDGRTGTGMIPPGGRAEASLGVVRESAQAWCTVPGHKEAGMVLDVVVRGTAEATAAGDDGGTGATIDFAAEFPAEFVPYDPVLKPAPGGREHQVTFRATEKVVEVAPGVTQELWTFNDQVPGPVLRGKVGDLFTVTLVNEGKLGHSIDFHASKVAWNDEMRTIPQGESLVNNSRPSTPACSCTTAARPRPSTTSGTACSAPS